jgi:hypothetical protein
VNEVVEECDKLRKEWLDEKKKKAEGKKHETADKEHAEKQDGTNDNESQAAKKEGTNMSKADKEDASIVDIFNVVKRILINFEPNSPANDRLANEWLKRCDFVSNHAFRQTRKQRFHDEVERKMKKKYCSERESVT